jgi:hypothetical protein
VTQTSTTATINYSQGITDFTATRVSTGRTDITFSTPYPFNGNNFAVISHVYTSSGGAVGYMSNCASHSGGAGFDHYCMSNLSVATDKGFTFWVPL